MKQKVSNLSIFCWGKTEFFVTMRNVLLTKIKPEKSKIKQDKIKKPAT